MAKAKKMSDGMLKAFKAGGNEELAKYCFRYGKITDDARLGNQRRQTVEVDGWQAVIFKIKGDVEFIVTEQPKG